MIALLDTHAVIWFATESTLLGKRSRLLCDEALAAEELAVCSITFWEIALLISKGRLDALMPTSELRAALLESGVTEVPLTGDIALAAASLDLHPDPADRFIAASAVALGATLVTADDRLLNWKYPLKRQSARK